MQPDAERTRTGPLGPGSDAAIAAGCSCPMLDNGHGRGYLGGVKDGDGNTVYVVNADCGVHGDAKSPVVFLNVEELS